MLKQQKGITLIALVITIVVLIILAGVLISLTLSDSGLFGKAKTGAESFKYAQNEETLMMTNVDAAVNDIVAGY